MKKVLFSIGLVAFALSMLIGDISLGAPKMFRVWVNGKAVVDSKVLDNIINETNKNLGKSIVIELRDEATKGITARSDEYTTDVKNISVTKLGKMFRVLVDGNVVVDSQNPAVIIETVKNVIEKELGEIIEIMPRDTLLNYDKGAFLNILNLATQGKGVGSESIALGSTRNEVIQKFGDPVSESIGDFPGTTEMMYGNMMGLTYFNADNRISQVSSLVTDQFKQVFSSGDLVKALGKPHKITKVPKVALKKWADKGVCRRFKVLPIHTYKAGENYVHFIVLQIEVDEPNSLQMVFTVVDSNCEVLEELELG